MNKVVENFESTEDFAALLEESLADESKLQGTVVKGKIINLDNDAATIDVGLKSEGRISLKEFADNGQPADLKVGDEVDVFIDRIEGRDGCIVLSRDKARREEAWTMLEKAHEAKEKVDGVIFGRVKGGFAVDLSGATAFLPGSQVDIRPIKDATPLIGNAQPFQVLKIDRLRGNIVVSRRAVLEETRSEERDKLIESLAEGKELQGVVKNITDYGAFVDLGGVDGLLHITDISWKRIHHPSEKLELGDVIDVKIIKMDEKTKRVSLGMKQLLPDPWQEVDTKFAIGNKVQGEVTNITDYGAFVELAPGVEGLIHVTEMSWTKKNVHPGKILSTSESVDVLVLEIDHNKRRISLGLKQASANPWQKFSDNNKVGDVIKGTVRNTTEFGLFVTVADELDGMVHTSDISWTENGEKLLSNYNRGDEIEVKILDIDVTKERVALGIKQLADDPIGDDFDKIKRGDVTTCTITAIGDHGLEVKVGDLINGFIKRADLAKERSEQRLDRFAEGEKVDAKVVSVDNRSRTVSLSIRAYETEEEKKVMKKYGSTDSGATIGDILGAAMKGADGDDSSAEAAAEEKPASKKTTKKAAAKKSEDVSEDKVEEKKAAAK